MTARRLLWSAALAALALPVVAGRAPAQIALTITGGPATFPAPTVTDYDAGYVANPAGLAFQLGIAGAATNRTTTVSIRASSATLGGGKPVSDLEWRRADLGTWNQMSVSDAVIESRPVRKNTLNDPWGNTVFLRMRLTWANDAPATYTTDLVVTLTVTTP